MPNVHLMPLSLQVINNQCSINKQRFKFQTFEVWKTSEVRFNINKERFKFQTFEVWKTSEVKFNINKERFKFQAFEVWKTSEVRSLTFLTTEPAHHTSPAFCPGKIAKRCAPFLSYPGR